MTKKYFFLSAALAVALAGCQTMDGDAQHNDSPPSMSKSDASVMTEAVDGADTEGAETDEDETENPEIVVLPASGITIEQPPRENDAPPSMNTNPLPSTPQG